MKYLPPYLSVLAYLTAWLVMVIYLWRTDTWRSTGSRTISRSTIPLVVAFLVVFPTLLLAWSTYYLGIPILGLPIALVWSVFWLIWATRKHRLQPWTAPRFLRFSLTCLFCAAFFHAAYTTTIEKVPTDNRNTSTGKMMQDHEKPSLPVLAESFGASFVRGIVNYGWIWTLFGLWLTFHAARVRQSGAIGYDDVLTLLTEMIERRRHKAWENWILKEKTLGHINDEQKSEHERKVGNQHGIEMKLLTPSNGNVSCRDFGVYERYRKMLIEAARNGYVNLAIKCLEETDIKKLYGAYRRTASQSKSTRKKEGVERYVCQACLDAVCLYRYLLNLTKEHNSKLETWDSDSAIRYAKHVITTPEEVLIWVPHNLPTGPWEECANCRFEQEWPRLKRGAEDPETYLGRLERTSGECLTRLRASGSSRRAMWERIPRCVAFGSDDPVMVEEVKGW